MPELVILLAGESVRFREACLCKEAASKVRSLTDTNLSGLLHHNLAQHRRVGARDPVLAVAGKLLVVLLLDALPRELLVPAGDW
jgi:hypothetical protein